MEKSNWQNNGMGGMAMRKCEDWQKESFYNEIKRKHFQGWYGGLQFSNVYTTMVFFKERASLNKLILEHFFTSLLNNLSIEDLLTLGNFLSTKFMNPR